MRILLVLTLLFSLAVPSKSYAEIDPKVKAFGVICAYGTVGGALLGFASMSFGGSSRSIAQGASLGLYAGIAFASYVVFTHNSRFSNGSSEYFEEQDNYPEGGYGYPEESPYGAPVPQEDDTGFFGGGSRAMEINSTYRQITKKGDNMPPLYINFMNINF